LKSQEKENRDLPDGGKNSEKRLWYFFGFLGVLVVCFVKPLISLAVYAMSTDLHSHTILVPFVTAYLVYMKRGEFPESCGTSVWWGGVGVMVGVSALGLLYKGDPYSENDALACSIFAWVSFLIAGAFLFLGKEWMGKILFPAAFLVFMIPLPDRVVEWLEISSQLATAGVSGFFFQVSNTPLYRDGTTFYMPGVIIEVARECSGIRSSWVLFITSLLVSHLFLNKFWHRVLLVALVVPLGIFRNALRVFVIGFLCVHVDREMIHSAIHKQGGPFFFALSLIPLFGVLWWLRRRQKRNGSDGGAR